MCLVQAGRSPSGGNPWQIASAGQPATAAAACRQIAMQAEPMEEFASLGFLAEASQPGHVRGDLWMKPGNHLRFALAPLIQEAPQ